VRIHRLTTSHAPVFLVNSRLALVSAAPQGSWRKATPPQEAPLLPKLRGQFAEFLHQSSLDRLGILYLPTCVGLGYGHHVRSLGAFLGSMGSADFAWNGSDSRLGVCARRIFLPDPLHACSGTTNARYAYPPASPHRYPLRDWSRHGGTGISTRCASTTPLGLALAPDSPWADEPSPGTLGHSAEGFLPPRSLLMPAFALERAPRQLPRPLHRPLDAPLPIRRNG